MQKIIVRSVISSGATTVYTYEIFWDVMQRWFVGSYWRFFLDCLTFEDGTDKLSRNVGNELPINAA
jgi:hypothetical protein